MRLLNQDADKSKHTLLFTKKKAPSNYIDWEGRRTTFIFIIYPAYAENKRIHFTLQSPII